MIAPISLAKHRHVSKCTRALLSENMDSLSSRPFPRYRHCENVPDNRQEDSISADQALRHDQVLRATLHEDPHCSANRSRLYNSNSFSDITISFSGRKVKAHRIVLCGQSAYFDKLLNPDSGFMVSLYIPRKRVKASTNDSFQEANATEITLHDDDPAALETTLRYLYGFGFKTSLFVPLGGPVSEAIFVLQVLITADKYGVDRGFIDEVEKFFTSSVSEMKDPKDIMSVLQMCTIGSEVHPSLEAAVDNILSVHMRKLIELPEWSDWTHSLPSVSMKIFKEAAQMKVLKRKQVMW